MTKPLWHEPPRRHYAPIRPAVSGRQKADDPCGALAVICFLAAIVLIAVFIPVLF
jgi:hypothetical protein